MIYRYDIKTVLIHTSNNKLFVSLFLCVLTKFNFSVIKDGKKSEEQMEKENAGGKTGKICRERIKATEVCFK